MSSGIEEMEAELNAGGMQECRIFAMVLRKYRKDCENFATIAKISQSLRNFAMHSFSLRERNFAIIAKIPYHSENYCA